MANEARIQASLQIAGGNAGSLQFQSHPTSFQADVSEGVGPTPGYVLATQTGTLIDLSALSTPGLAWVQNLDPTNYVEFGIYDPDTNEFYPLEEWLPGECYIKRFSRFLGQEFGTSLPGTSPSGSGIRAMVRGIGGSCACLIHVFNK